jgi:hypothetical protein
MCLGDQSWPWPWPSKRRLPSQPTATRYMVPHRPDILARVATHRITLMSFEPQKNVKFIKYRPAKA